MIYNDKGGLQKGLQLCLVGGLKRGFFHPCVYHKYFLHYGPPYTRCVLRWRIFCDIFTFGMIFRFLSIKLGPFNLKLYRWNLYLEFVKRIFKNIITVFSFITNRPCVAGAVLQTALSLINSQTE